MKLRTFLFVVLYFLIFVIVIYFLYVKYYHRFFNKNQGQSIPQENRQELIYYTSGNNLFQLNPYALTQNSADIPNLRLQSTGVINQLCIDTKRNLFFYSVLTPAKNYEIWKVSLKDNSSEKLFSAQTPGLEKYKNFRDPKLSYDNQKLGFIASHDQIDNLFSWQIDDSVLTNLTSENFSGEVTDFAWSPDTNKIALAGVINSKNVIKILDEKSINDFLVQDDTIKQLEYLKNTLIFSQIPKDSIATNILSIALADKKITPLTDFAAPKTVSDFAVSLDGQNLVFTGHDNQTHQNDIYILKTDGTDLLQLTTDGKSSEPVFSPKSDQIAYWSKNVGIFIIKTNKANPQKILNSESPIDKILTWR